MRWIKNMWRRLVPAKTLEQALLRLENDMRDGTVQPERFSMEMWEQPGQGCGTVMCIGGWLVAYGHADLLRAEGCQVNPGGTGFLSINADHAPAPLRNLFLPGYFRDDQSDGSGINCQDPKLAADAIRNWRRGAYSPWKGVCEEEAL